MAVRRLGRGDLARGGGGWRRVALRAAARGRRWLVKMAAGWWFPEDGADSGWERMAGRGCRIVPGWKAGGAAEARSVAGLGYVGQAVERRRGGQRRDDALQCGGAGRRSLRAPLGAHGIIT